MSKGCMDPAIENSLLALITPDNVLTTKALVKGAAEESSSKWSGTILGQGERPHLIC